ncbi:MAG: hypothetical protein ABL940_07975, partial [Bacteroidia bacterium]
MKKLTLSVLALATVASFTACKKGTEDPALSFRTRDSRMAGEWKLSTAEIVKSYRKSGGAGTAANPTFVETLTKNETYDGTTVKKSAVWSEVQTPGSTNTETSTFNGKYEMTLTILKDGTVKVATTTAPTSVTGVTSPANTLPSGLTVSPSSSNSSFGSYDYTNFDGTYNYAASTTKSENTGRWSWSDSRKNKVMVNIDGLGTFYVKELRNKTLVLVNENANTGSTVNTTSSDDSGSSVATLSLI